MAVSEKLLSVSLYNVDVGARVERKRGSNLVVLKRLMFCRLGPCDVVRGLLSDPYLSGPGVDSACVREMSTRDISWGVKTAGTES